MKIVFVSNYYNHHQSSFCREMDKLTDHEFRFIECEPMDDERVKLGWGDQSKPAYVLNWCEDPSASEFLVMDADALLIGGSDDKYILPRLNAGKLTFRIEETIFKKGFIQAFNPHVWSMLLKSHYRYRNKPVYMLCASSNLPGELKTLNLYKDKAFKWGYYPEVHEYDIESLLAGKILDPIEIVWCGRFIDWKHPEEMVELAAICRELKLPVHITMIGNGIMFDEIKQKVISEKLEEMISMLGALPSSEVRSYMEKATVFVATSGREEGWGAVLNEAMNSGCIVFAKREMGAAGFLIEDGKNGYMYDRIDEAAKKIKVFSKSFGADNSLPKYAYETIISEWRGDVAADRLYDLVNAILVKKELPNWKSGPCSNV